jgi:uncharacterized damage-inducible protein DinB
MQTLKQFNRYNAWANRRVFDLCRSERDLALAETARGTVGSIEQTLKHLVAVEDGYLALLQGRDMQEAMGGREEYHAHDLSWFGRRSQELAGAYAALLSGEEAEWLECALEVPWLGATLTRRDGLLQVLTHSAQHRAQVLSVLGERGTEVPNLDYVFMLADEGSASPR